MKAISILFLLKGIFSGAFFAFFPNWILQKSGTAADIAFIWLIYYVIQIVLNLPTGHLSDQSSHKRASLIGLVICVLCFLGAALVEYRFFDVSIAVWGYAIGDSFLSGSLHSWYQELLEQRKIPNVKNTIRRDQFERGGMIIGALGLLPFLGNLSKPWLVFALLFCAMAFLCFQMPTTKPHASNASPEDALTWNKIFKIFKLKFFMFYFVSSFFYGIASGLFTSLLWPRLHELGQLGLSIGVIQAMLSGSRLLGQQIWAKSPWVEKDLTPSVSLFLGGAAMFAFSLMDNLMMAMGTWLIFILLLSIHLPSLDFQVLRLNSRLKATSFSAITMAMLIGAAAGNMGILKLQGLEMIHLAQISSICLVISAFPLFWKWCRIRALG